MFLTLIRRPRKKQIPFNSLPNGHFAIFHRARHSGILFTPPLLSVSMREQGHRRLQARKEWSRTRVCENAHFSHVLALEKKNGSA